MELPHLGKQCSAADCKQLDFLPLICECGNSFCSEHFSRHIETCDVIVKPKDVDLKKFDNLYVCSEEKCRVTSLVPLICDVCNKHYCIKHRHVVNYHHKDQEKLSVEREKHAEHKKRAEETKAAVNRQIENTIMEAKKKERSRKTANKVQLMRLKAKATGLKTVPPSDRLYLNMHVKRDSEERLVPIFVSKTWSVGRAIDAIAAECKLQNNNNKANAKKLRLFKDDGTSLSGDTSSVLLELLDSDAICDGEDLIIQYVESV